MFQSEFQELCDLFESASLYVRSVVGRLGSDDLLYLYARFKKAKDGSCNTLRPGFFDFQGKQKWDAWKGMDGVGAEECMKQYISKLNQLHDNWQDDMKSGKGGKVGFGVGVSKMVSEVGGEALGDDLHDLCKQGLLDRLVKKVEEEELEDVNQLDDQGMSMLHWSCDRGHTSVVHYLLSRGADVNIRDSDLQTPLHYAVSCEYEDIITLLLSNSADVSLQDVDHLSPVDVACKAHHKQLLLGVVDGCAGVT